MKKRNTWSLNIKRIHINPELRSKFLIYIFSSIYIFRYIAKYHRQIYNKMFKRNHVLRSLLQNSHDFFNIAPLSWIFCHSFRESFLQQFRKEHNALLKSSTADISEIPSRPFLGIPIIFQ